VRFVTVLRALKWKLSTTFNLPYCTNNSFLKLCKNCEMHSSLKISKSTCQLRDTFRIEKFVFFRKT
jgi:hypothetical protein